MTIYTFFWVSLTFLFRKGVGQGASSGEAWKKSIESHHCSQAFASCSSGACPVWTYLNREQLFQAKKWFWCQLSKWNSDPFCKPGCSGEESDRKCTHPHFGMLLSRQTHQGCGHTSAYKAYWEPGAVRPQDTKKGFTRPAKPKTLRFLQTPLPEVRRRNQKKAPWRRTQWLWKKSFGEEDSLQHIPAPLSRSRCSGMQKHIPFDVFRLPKSSKINLILKQSRKNLQYNLISKCRQAELEVPYYILETLKPTKPNGSQRTKMPNSLSQRRCRDGRKTRDVPGFQKSLSLVPGYGWMAIAIKN